MSLTTGAVDRLRTAPATASGGPWGQIRALTAKSVRATLANRRLVLVASLEPLLMLVVFGQIFAGVSGIPGFPPGIGYVDFLVPALLVNCAVQSAAHAGTALTEEIRGGLATRLRAMPVWPGALLVARSLAALVRAALQLTVLLALAWAVFGFRPAGGAAGTVSAVLLALVVGWCLGWVFIALTCCLRNAEVTQTLAGLALFPLFFASTAFVPLTALPGWLQAVAKVNPMSYGIIAARDLASGTPVGTSVLVTVVAGLAVAVVAAGVALRGFGRGLPGAPR